MKHIKLFEGKRKDRYMDELIDSITFGNNIIFNNTINNFHKDNSISNLYNINFENSDGWTPISAAVYHERRDILKKLIEFGSDINYIDSGGYTALIFAAEEDKFEMVLLLIEYDADWNIKNNMGKTFLDYLEFDYMNIIIEDYPDKYKDYLMKRDLDRYNL